MPANADMIGNVVMRFDEFDKTFDKSTNIVFNDIR